ncbi:MAG: protein adenylyltransferase SelO family protein [Gammaproteobacteria bacterium]
MRSPLFLKPSCSQNLASESHYSLAEISNGIHSYRSLGSDYYIDINVENVRGARLVLFNRDLAQELNINLPECDEELERIVLDNFAWFKCADQQSGSITANNTVKTYFATRYQDSDDKSEGNALGDGRAIWVGEIISEPQPGRFRYLDVVLKGTGVTPLAWFNHPRQSHKDGMASMTEVVHEYIYSSAARKNGINTAGILAVIELPFYRETDNEKAAIIVRVGNHLRFAHLLYFSDSPALLKKIFEYALKRDMGLSLDHLISVEYVQKYLDLVVTKLAENAAVYFDIHAVHGSPTFGNKTSCGGSIDMATFVFPDAHHAYYSYMPNGTNLLGGVNGQTEQFFNLFSHLIKILKKSGFDYQTEILPVEYFHRQFRNKFEEVSTYRWLKRIGLSDHEIDALSIPAKERFYEIVKSIYEATGSKRIRLNKGKVYMAAFEPRKILSGTADCFESLDVIVSLWGKLFKVNRKWGTYTLSDAKPYIIEYRKSIIGIFNDLKASKDTVDAWKQRSKEIKLSERHEPGSDFFYDSERFLASEEVLHLIRLGNASWRTISQVAETSTIRFVDYVQV